MTLKIPQLLEEALGFNLNRVSLLMRREFIKALKEYDLTPEQWQVLVGLWEGGRPLNQQQISQITLRDKHTISRMLTRMERNGWVARRSSKEDKRTREVLLTQKALNQREEIVNRLVDYFKPMWGWLSTEEHDTLMAILKRLRSTMEKEDGLGEGLTEPPP